ERTCINSPILLAITGASAYYDYTGCTKGRPYICKEMEKPRKRLENPEPSETVTAFYIVAETQQAYIKVQNKSELEEYQKLSIADKHQYLKEHHDKIVGLDEEGLPILSDLPKEKA
ncbi:hypothetical protein BGX21_007882, partial [Mortierella sp. AD011]